MKPEHVLDPVADPTLWEPLAPGGTNFRTRNMVSDDPQKIVYRPASGSILFGLLFAAIGAVALSASAVWWTLNERVFDPFMLIPLLVGSVFGFLGCAHLRLTLIPLVFDKSEGVFRRGRTQIPLEEIRALQILKERVSTGSCGGVSVRFDSYEINLVLVNGDRVNVIDHEDEPASVRAEAAELGRFLSKPVWEASAQG